ncbi:MAG: hypothetical protein ACU83V_00710 [Gammaproteobacteria bacterium]
MANISSENTPGTSRIEVSRCRVLVDPAKSRRLREMQQGVNGSPKAQQHIADQEPDNRFALAPEVNKAWLRARRCIDDEINKIMRSFPEGRKKSLFKIRFGSLDEIRALEIQAIFKLLKLDYRQADLKDLHGLNYHGNRVF